MWVWKDAAGKVREFSPHGATPKKCPICGQYFRKSEKACAVVPPMEVRKMHKKISQNIIVHYDEWEEFCAGVTDDTALAEKFLKHKTPSQHAFTPSEEKRIEAFASSCYKHGFYEVYKKPYGVKCQKRGSSLNLEYNVFADTIDISHRGKKGIFDSFYERQIIANVYNLMHEILNDGKHDGYSAQKTINSIFAEANSIIKT